MTDTQSGARFAGEWWLPGNPNHRAHGTLKVEERRAELEMAEPLSREWYGDLAHVADGVIQLVPAVHGNAAGTDFTLLGCDLPVELVGSPIITLDADAILQGAHVEHADDDRFAGACLRIQNLNAYAGNSGLRVSANGALITPVRDPVHATAIEGLVPAEVTGDVLDPAGPDFVLASPAASTRTTKITLTVPEGATARVATYEADYAQGTDIDIATYQAGTNVDTGSSFSSTAQEVVDLGPGTYDVYFTLFATLDRKPVAVKGHSFVLGSAAQSNFTATPASQPTTVNGAASIALSWTGLTPGLRYLGAVSYSDGSTNNLARTVVTVN